MSQLKWRIWYDDGSTFDSSMGEPRDAPDRGVICIANHDLDEWSSGSNVQWGNPPEAGESYFVWDRQHKRWFNADLQGLLDWCLRTGLVKWGRYTAESNWREILFKATHDPDFHSEPPPPEIKAILDAIGRRNKARKGM